MRIDIIIYQIFSQFINSNLARKHMHNGNNNNSTLMLYVISDVVNINN